MVLTNMICEYHEIKDGSMELACNGLSALAKAFIHDANISINDPNYDLIAAIHREHGHSPITWTMRHVKGHQDNHTDFNLLDRWSKLNIEVMP
jgi:hypothetical protein